MQLVRAGIQGAGSVPPAVRDKLIAVLSFHALPGKAMSGDTAGKTLDVPTARGQTVLVDASSGVTVNGANVVTADIEASNGIVHVIDAVILPPSM